MDLRIEQQIGRAREAFERRDYAAALVECQAVLERHPDFADLRNLAGLCLGFLGRGAEALREFDAALAINPGYAEAHLNRAIVLHELGRYAEAQGSLERAGTIELEGAGAFATTVSARLANAHAELGDLYRAAGSPAAAAAQYRTALELRPRFADIRRKLAQSLADLGSVEEAEAELGRALEENPRFLDARLDLGLLHFRRGDTDGAAAAWRQVLAVAPDHSRGQAYLAMVERHAVAHDAGES